MGCHIPDGDTSSGAWGGGCLTQQAFLPEGVAGRVGMRLPAARTGLLMAKHLLECNTPSPPTSQHVGTRFVSTLPGCPIVSHASTALLEG